METKDKKMGWEEYVATERERVEPLLNERGFTLDEYQPHLGGERHLTGAPGSGRKLVLLGRRTADNKRVVIKASSERGGTAEILHERTCRRVLEEISFAYQTFRSPQELLFVQTSPYTILITEFIEQERPFVERPLEEQFALALKAFKAQESAHATTYTHARVIANTFGEMSAEQYYVNIQHYAQDIAGLMPEEKELGTILDAAIRSLRDNRTALEQYCGFLTHWDFTPQNIRVKDGDMYLLDHSSLRFGNKYEGWARFINFMVLYNPALAAALVQYVRDNRAPEELLSLKLMRVYRLVELVRYYATWLPRTEGSLNKLAQARITFWSGVLQAILRDKEVAAGTIESYKKERDTLRSEEEKQRQVGLH